MFRLKCLVHWVGFKIEVALYGVSHRARNLETSNYDRFSDSGKFFLKLCLMSRREGSWGLLAVWGGGGGMVGNCVA